MAVIAAQIVLVAVSIAFSVRMVMPLLVADQILQGEEGLAEGWAGRFGC